VEREGGGDELQNGARAAFWWGVRRGVDKRDSWWVKREDQDLELLKNVWELLVWAKSAPGN